MEKGNVKEKYCFVHSSRHSDVRSTTFQLNDVRIETDYFVNESTSHAHGFGSCVPANTGHIKSNYFMSINGYTAQFAYQSFIFQHVTQTNKLEQSTISVLLCRLNVFFLPPHINVGFTLVKLNLNKKKTY